MVEPASSVGALEKLLGYSFQQPEFLLQALTHKSYVNENPPAAAPAAGGPGDNERLEFLGDAVLELKVSEMLYARFPDKPEGELSRMRSRIVNTSALARFSESLGLGAFLRLGRGELRQGGRRRVSLLADTFEALLAALYLDGGGESVDKLVRDLVGRELESTWTDHKSQLQEYLQEVCGRPPVYKLVERRGADHQPLFFIEVYDSSGRRLGRGQGPSRKIAEQKAASEALRGCK